MQGGGDPTLKMMYLGGSSVRKTNYGLKSIKVNTIALLMGNLLKQN
jgi:hypothetical protein